LLHVSFSANLFICLHFLNIVVCLIGCSSLQHSKFPWRHVTQEIEKLDNKEIRSHFIKDFEALYQKHKGSEGVYLKLADLVMDTATMKSAKPYAATVSKF